MSFISIVNTTACSCGHKVSAAGGLIGALEQLKSTVIHHTILGEQSQQR